MAVGKKVLKIRAQAKVGCHLLIACSELNLLKASNIFVFL